MTSTLSIVEYDLVADRRRYFEQVFGMEGELGHVLAFDSFPPHPLQKGLHGLLRLLIPEAYKCRQGRVLEAQQGYQRWKKISPAKGKCCGNL